MNLIVKEIYLLKILYALFAHYHFALLRMEMFILVQAGRIVY